MNVETKTVAETLRTNYQKLITNLTSKLKLTVAVKYRACQVIKSMYQPYITMSKSFESECFPGTALEALALPASCLFCILFYALQSRYIEKIHLQIASEVCDEHKSSAIKTSTFIYHVVTKVK